MKHVIIGTAGHVDHGKTSLIQALTGTNTDRLKEEQERGMTIDLGFAALRLPDGTIAGIVDVPGHERFLKNMLAGISGVDVVLLVIAADESVMPQTIEHLDILRLLDVKNGVVALTKMDLVDKEWTDAVEEDVRSHLNDTFLSNSPIIRVSSTTGKGLDALKRALLSAVSRADARDMAMPFRLPIDRVFTRPGFGTVVTGTLVAGTLRSGDTVEVLPQRISARVRGLQVHNQKVTEAEAGSRVAVNLVGIEMEQVARGAQVAVPGSILPTTSFDATLKLLPTMTHPLQDRDRVRVHIGTAEILGRVRILGEADEISGGVRAYIQFRGENEFACARGDRYVLRSYSPMETLGGGIILDAAPAKHAKADTRVLDMLAARERGTPEDLVETLLQRYPVGILRKDVNAAVHLGAIEVEAAIDMLVGAGRAIRLPYERLIHGTVMGALSHRAIATVNDFHKQFPLRMGIPKEELRAALGRNVDARSFGSLIAYWQEQSILVTEAATVRLPDFKVELNERQEALLHRIEMYYTTQGVEIPTIEDVCRDVKAPPDAVNALLKVGVERKRFVRIADGTYYAADTLTNLKQLVRDYASEHGSITVGVLRDLTQSNRKFALIALEYLDSLRFTRRQGDERTVIE